jgi:hypothetical protein
MSRSKIALLAWMAMALLYAAVSCPSAQALPYVVEAEAGWVETEGSRCIGFVAPFRQQIKSVKVRTAASSCRTSCKTSLSFTKICVVARAEAGPLCEVPFVKCVMEVEFTE